MDIGTMEQWTREDGLYKAEHGGYFVTGTRYFGPRGEIGWHTSSYPFENPIHAFFVVDSVFQNIAMRIENSWNGHPSFNLLGVAENVSEAEHNAVLGAIKIWETCKEDS
jgi:hypothetical protein